MKKLRLKISFIFLGLIILNLSLAIFLHPNIILAGDTSVGSRLKAVAEEAGWQTGSEETGIAEVIALIIKMFLSIVGVIFIVLIIYSGFRWMTSGGEEEAIRKAKKTIVAATIGLVIVILAYTLTYFIFEALLNSEGGGIIAS